MGPRGRCRWRMRTSAHGPAEAISALLSPTIHSFLSPSWLAKVIPHRLRRKLRSRIRSRQSPASTVSSLETSCNPADTLDALRGHEWSWYDAQYLVLFVLALFALCIIETYGPLFKTAVSALLLTALVIPITRQFFLPFLPIATWLVFFYSCRSVSPFAHHRVNVLCHWLAGRRPPLLGSLATCQPATCTPC